jgi:hypothetical protein
MRRILHLFNSGKVALLLTVTVMPELSFLTQPAENIDINKTSVARLHEIFMMIWFYIKNEKPRKMKKKGFTLNK